MEKLEVLIKKVDNIIPGRIFGLLSITAGILGDIISYLMFPGYNCLTMPVSTLCLGPGGIFFNIGNVFSGIFALIFVNSLIRNFNENFINKKVKKIALICANISCIAFVILGVFCGSNIIIRYIHGTAAITSWCFGYFYITFCNLLMLQDKNFSKNLAIFGLIITFPLLLLMILFFLHLIPLLTAPLIIILPPLEWVNTISVIIWYFSVSTYMIYRGI
ncbi:MAG: hypothetical protein ACFFE5_16560 [Candidatus Thorarchaeota archaeon]